MKRKALFILASKDFKDEEYFVSREILKSADFEIAIAGDVKGLAMGADGGEVESEMSLDEVTVDNFDVLLFIGGPGCLRYLDNESHTGSQGRPSQKELCWLRYVFLQLFWLKRDYWMKRKPRFGPGQWIGQQSRFWRIMGRSLGTRMWWLTMGL